MLKFGGGGGVGSCGVLSSSPKATHNSLGHPCLLKITYMPLVDLWKLRQHYVKWIWWLASMGNSLILWDEKVIKSFTLIPSHHLPLCDFQRMICDSSAFIYSPVAQNWRRQHNACNSHSGCWNKRFWLFGSQNVLGVRGIFQNKSYCMWSFNFKTNLLYFQFS